MFELDHGLSCVIKRCGKPICSAHSAHGLESTCIAVLYHADLFGNVSFELLKLLQFHIEIKGLQTRLSRFVSLSFSVWVFCWVSVSNIDA